MRAKAQTTPSYSAPVLRNTSGIPDVLRRAGEPLPTPEAESPRNSPCWRGSAQAIARTRDGTPAAVRPDVLAPIGVTHVRCVVDERNER